MAIYINLLKWCLPLHDNKPQLLARLKTAGFVWVLEAAEHSKQRLEMAFTAGEVMNMLDYSFTGSDSSDNDLEMDTEDFDNPFFRDTNSRMETEIKLKIHYNSKTQKIEIIFSSNGTPAIVMLLELILVMNDS